MTVQPKADRDHKVVSASSICAKVTRDTIIHEWKFIENIGNFYFDFRYRRLIRKWLYI